MPSGPRLLAQIAQEAVTAILSGKALDGSLFPLSIPFTASEETRAVAAELLEHIIAEHRDLTQTQLTALTAKLLSHLSRAGLQTPDAIHNFPARTLADALRDRPDLITGRAGIAAILRAHERRTQQTAANLRRRPPLAIPDRKTLWQDRRFRLAEVTDPRHLYQDSMTLGHCVGTLWTKGVPQPELHPEHPNALQGLHYWRKIKSGELRILSFMMGVLPVVTMEIKERSITQMIGCPDYQQDPHIFKPLYRAIHAVKEALRLIHIEDLPKPPPDALLSRDGSFIAATPENIPEAIAGTVALPPAVTPAMVHAAASTALLSVDLGHGSSTHLESIPAHPNANLLIRSHASCHVPNIQTGRITIDAPGDISLPRFRSGTILLDHAQTLQLPAFKTGRLEAMSLLSAHLPVFERGDILIRNIPGLSLPELIGADYLSLSNTRTLSVPKLVQGFIVINADVTLPPLGYPI